MFDPVVRGITDRLVEASRTVSRSDDVPQADPSGGKAFQPRLVIELL